MKNKRKYLPYSYKEIESFSRINEIRIAKGFTRKSLASRSSVPKTTLTAICNGTLSPLRKNRSKTGKISIGDWKPQVLRIAYVLKVPVEEMFPQFVRDQEKRFTDAQLLGMSMSMRTENSVDNIVMARDFLSKLLELAEENLSAVNKKIFFGIMVGKTQQEIATEMGITRSGVGQALARIYKKLNMIWNINQSSLAKKATFFEKTELHLK